MGDYLIVDFYGLPGSGKSTVSHQAAEQLRKSGYVVDEVSYDMDHYHSGRMRALLKVTYVILLLIRSPKTFLNLSYVIIKNGSPLFSMRFYRYILNIGYKLYASKYRRFVDIIFFDEGFCQTILSLYYRRKFDNCKNALRELENLLPDTLNIVHIFVKTDNNTTIQRLLRRQDGESRVDRLSENDMRQILDEQMTLCQLLPYNQIINNNDDMSIALNGEELRNYISGIMNK